MTWAALRMDDLLQQANYLAHLCRERFTCHTIRGSEMHELGPLTHSPVRPQSQQHCSTIAVLQGHLSETGLATKHQRA